MLRGLLGRISGAGQACLGKDCPLWCIPRGSGGFGVAMDVVCPLGHYFCSGCGEVQLHKPATCAMVKEWKIPANEEGAMEVWKNTVITDKDGKKVRQAWDCPKCGALVQKDGGCVHFTHSLPQGCGHHFCWSCLK